MHESYFTFISLLFKQWPGFARSGPMSVRARFVSAGNTSFAALLQKFWSMRSRKYEVVQWLAKFFRKLFMTVL